LAQAFFIKHLSVTPEDALMLHQQYYKDYGLAIEALARFHKINPMEFNREVDDALPLDDILSPDPELRALLEAFDKTKIKLWLFTNAHITHGMRVIRLLGVGESNVGAASYACSLISDSRRLF
jgi:pyrimidine and pyridine-specific 5'-nucleotidase